MLTRLHISIDLCSQISRQQGDQSLLEAVAESIGEASRRHPDISSMSSRSGGQAQRLQIYKKYLVHHGEAIGTFRLIEVHGSGYRRFALTSIDNATAM